MTQTPALPIPLWQQEGFAAEPELRPASWEDVIYRVTALATKDARGKPMDTTGNCFFVGASDRIDVSSLTAVELEYNLNAALWGNRFQILHWYSLVEGTRYWVGPIAQTGLMGRGGVSLVYDDPKGLGEPNRGQLRQVTLVDVDERSGVVRRVLSTEETRARVKHEMEAPVRGASYIGRTGNRPRSAPFGRPGHA
jgi:hypothetical protein